MSTSLLVEGARHEAALASLARRSVLRYVKLAVPGIAVLVIGASLLLRPFGSSYEDRGTALLRLLLIAAVPQAIVTLYLSVERVRANVGRVLAVEAAVVVLATSGAIIGMSWLGLNGVGLAWLLAQSVVAAVVAPALWRACREVVRP